MFHVLAKRIPSNGGRLGFFLNLRGHIERETWFLHIPSHFCEKIQDCHILGSFVVKGLEIFFRSL